MTKSTCVEFLFTRWLYIGIFVILVGILVIWIKLGGAQRWALMKEARVAYESSRSNSSTPGSYEFLTMGLTANMSEDQVDKLMSRATQSFKHMPQESPPWSGYVNIYLFKYEPKWWNPIFKRWDCLYEERFWVYFDHAGHAKKMIRFLSTVDEWGPKSQEIDLETRTISRW